jgi:hypothetical protein
MGRALSIAAPSSGLHAGGTRMDRLDVGWLGEPAVQIVLHCLYGVRRKAVKLHYRPEKFFLSLENFLCTGFAPDQARLLAQAGYIGWDEEKQVLWLTAAGARALKTAKNVASDDDQSVGGVASGLHVPTWWRRTGELYVGDERVRQFRPDAVLGRAVLDVCQKSGWAWSVRSPFADRGAKRVQMLTDALRTLNAGPDPARLLFEAEKNSLYLHWIAV